MTNSLAESAEIQQSYDDDLQRRVFNFLLDQQQEVLRDLEIHADRGSVVVAGKVNSAVEKQRCLSCCQRVAGVIKLIDQIDVA